MANSASNGTAISDLFSTYCYLFRNSEDLQKYFELSVVPLIQSLINSIGINGSLDGPNDFCLSNFVSLSERVCQVTMASCI